MASDLDFVQFTKILSYTYDFKEDNYIFCKYYSDANQNMLINAGLLWVLASAKKGNVFKK
jgi:hypothetical protein